MMVRLRLGPSFHFFFFFFSSFFFLVICVFWWREKKGRRAVVQRGKCPRGTFPRIIMEKASGGWRPVIDMLPLSIFLESE